LTEAGFFYRFLKGLSFIRLLSIKERVMKKLIIALIFWFVVAPVSAWGQKWIEPYTDQDGTQVEGHWQTPEDLRKERYSTPGKVNPYTGQFDPYGGSRKGPPSATPPPQKQTPMKGNPYYSLPDYRPESK
jgi:hypothetical protein